MPAPDYSLVLWCIFAALAAFAGVFAFLGFQLFILNCTLQRELFGLTREQLRSIVALKNPEAAAALERATQGVESWERHVGSSEFGP